jgi:hypothetical protein
MKATQVGQGYVGPLAYPAPQLGLSPLCSTKVGYQTAAAAHWVRRRRQPHEPAKLWVYRCQHPACPYFHITKMKPPAEAMRPQAGALTSLAKGGV